jgi:hypothetical protein
MPRDSRLSIYSIDPVPLDSLAMVGTAFIADGIRLDTFQDNDKSIERWFLVGWFSYADKLTRLPAFADNTLRVGATNP